MRGLASKPAKREFQGESDILRTARSLTTGKDPLNLAAPKWRSLRHIEES